MTVVFEADNLPGQHAGARGTQHTCEPIDYTLWQYLAPRGLVNSLILSALNITVLSALAVKRLHNVKTEPGGL